MKIISLNLWCGRVFEPLMDFIKTQSKDTDIFCFQEVLKSPDLKNYYDVRVNLLEELAQILVGFNYCYVPTLTDFVSTMDETVPSKVDFDLQFGQTIFFKKNLEILKQKSYSLYELKNPTDPKRFSDSLIVLQGLKLNNLKEDFNIFNFHGAAYPANKLDTDYRIEYSQKIKEILKNTSDKKVLMGDFNLLPETKSIILLEDGMRNLIKEFDIKETRSKLNPWYGKPNVQHFADYTFVSPDIKVKTFKVPTVEISDHLPMILEID